jgi:hypothetical protein
MVNEVKPRKILFQGLGLSPFIYKGIIVLYLSFIRDGKIDLFKAMLLKLSVTALLANKICNYLGKLTVCLMLGSGS